MWQKIWEKVRNFCKAIWYECKDAKTLILLIIVIIIAYSPVWLGYMFYFIFKWKWCLIVATGYLAFWAGPFTPFFPLCIAVTLFIKHKIFPKNMNIKLPYGHKELNIEMKNAGMLTSKLDKLKSDKDGRVLVREAMVSPIGSPRLKELSAGKKTCTVIISDHTRPVPSMDILPEMLKELREGNPDIDITLLVATGCHRLTTLGEIRDKVGDEIADKERIVVHDCDNNNVDIGILPSGAHLSIDRLAVETDLLIAEGFIEPHFFAGFSGGRKSVLPGVCARETVLGNHCGRFMDSSYARTGVLEHNPIHEDMVAAARMAGLKYIVNVVIDEKHRTVAAFAGDAIAAHEAGVAFLRPYVEVLVPKGKEADICITTNGGAPLDQNLYQCVKSMTAAEAATHDGSVLIICAECADGVGGEFFRRQLSRCDNVAELYRELTDKPQSETEPDAWQSQVLARVLMTRKVIVVTRPELKDIVEEMKMTYAASIEEAISMAYETVGVKAKVSVIPNGISIIVRNG